MPSSRESSHPRDLTQVFCIESRLFTIWANRDAPRVHELSLYYPCNMLYVYYSRVHVNQLLPQLKMSIKENPNNTCFMWIETNQEVILLMIITQPEPEYRPGCCHSANTCHPSACQLLHQALRCLSQLMVSENEQWWERNQWGSPCVTDNLIF